MKTYRQIVNHITSMCAHFCNVTGLTVHTEFNLLYSEVTWDDLDDEPYVLEVKISVEGLDMDMKPRKHHRLRLQRLYRMIETKYRVDLHEDEPMENPAENRLCSRATTHNRESITQSSQCGCYYCGKIFSASEVTTECYTKDGTACCPYCGVDSVFGDASGLEVSKKNLKKLHKRWFGSF